MSPSLTLIGTAKDGWLSLDEGQRTLLRSFCRDREGKPVHLTVSDPKRPRSTDQNRYLWGVVYQTIADETGHTTEEVHSFCKAAFLPREFIKIGEVEQEVEKSTTKLTSEEMTRYIHQINAFVSAELSLSLPQPDAL